ncbi:MAG: kinase [Pseudomonadota bacterium]|jgi:D-glycerate 3-kinase|nr:MAG: kinase [Pseudomonadota bacterium]
MRDWVDAFLERERLPQDYRHTIEHALVPLAGAITRRARLADHMVTVGLCGAQGSGKSTAAAALVELLSREDLPAAALSIDDFYLPRATRQELARRVHPLLATRGVPGTHDVELAQATIDQLALAGEVHLPSFDKARDDRRPHRDWPVAHGPMRVVILEGWCVGARPQDDAELAEPVNALERGEDPDGAWRRYVNDALKGPYRALFDRLSPLVLLQAPSFEVVHGWRAEQERKLAARMAREGGDASRVMDDAAIARFIAHYERVTRHILAEMPDRADHLIRLSATRTAQWIR